MILCWNKFKLNSLQKHVKNKSNRVSECPSLGARGGSEVA